MHDYKYLESAMETARDKDAGKHLSNNTRLFDKLVYHFDVPTQAYVVRYYNTDIVAVFPNGDAKLFNGGYDTVTTLQRINEYGSSHVISIKGEWFVQLQPDPDDPKPDLYQRQIPHPFDAVDPGPEPIKTDDGCIAGTTFEDEYQTEGYYFEWQKLGTGHVIKLGEDLFVRRWHNERVFYVDEVHKTYSYVNSEEFPAEFRAYERKQCPHCKAFDALHRDWFMAMEYGAGSWGSRKGYKLYRQMMDRFGSKEAWLEAAREDLAKRKAYLKAVREWWNRNHVAFFDGILVDAEGYAYRPDPKSRGHLEQSDHAWRNLHREKR